MRLTNSSIAAMNSVLAIKALDEGLQRVFEFLVLLRPACLLLCLAYRLFHVGG